VVVLVLLQVLMLLLVLVPKPLGVELLVLPTALH
jgi:hypothetical protein